MQDKSISEAIKHVLMDPHLLQTLQAQRDEYDEPRLDSLLTKVQYGCDIARCFGFDQTRTMAIQIITDLSLPCFGEIGEAFLRGIDESYSRAAYGRRLAQKLLCTFPSAYVNQIADGVEHTLLG